MYYRYNQLYTQKIMPLIIMRDRFFISCHKSVSCRKEKKTADVEITNQSSWGEAGCLPLSRKFGPRTVTFRQASEKRNLTKNSHESPVVCRLIFSELKPWFSQAKPGSPRSSVMTFPFLLFLSKPPTAAGSLWWCAASPWPGGVVGTIGACSPCYSLKSKVPSHQPGHPLISWESLLWAGRHPEPAGKGVCKM